MLFLYHYYANQPKNSRFWWFDPFWRSFRTFLRPIKLIKMHSRANTSVQNKYVHKNNWVLTKIEFQNKINFWRSKCIKFEFQKSTKPETHLFIYFSSFSRISHFSRPFARVMVHESWIQGRSVHWSLVMKETWTTVFCSVIKLVR